MLLGEGERPRASGMQPAAAQATNGLVIDLRHATAQLWAGRSKIPALRAGTWPQLLALGGLATALSVAPAVRAQRTVG